MQNNPGGGPVRILDPQGETKDLVRTWGNLLKVGGFQDHYSGLKKQTVNRSILSGMSINGEKIDADQPYTFFDQIMGATLAKVNVIFVKNPLRKKTAAVSLEQHAFVFPYGRICQSIAVNGGSALHIQDDSWADKGFQRYFIDRTAIFKKVLRRVYMGSRMGAHGH